AGKHQLSSCARPVKQGCARGLSQAQPPSVSEDSGTPPARRASAYSTGCRLTRDSESIMDPSLLNQSTAVLPQGQAGAAAGERTAEPMSVAALPAVLATDPVGWEALLWGLGWFVA